jgi:stage III sporulation protein AC
MDIELIFKLAGIGILLAVMVTLLNKAGRDDIGIVITIAGAAITLFMVVGLINDLFSYVKTTFNLF